MYYSDFCGMKISKLGFGAMRFPMKDGVIDEEQVEELIRVAIDQGVNYFDTAYSYLGGFSEIVLGRVLKRYPRESYYLATKYPGHQIADEYDVEAVFNEQLAKCETEYFDFYLLHNMYEYSYDVYTNPRWGIVNYLLQQKAKGRIKHIGFSTHGQVSCMRRFLEVYGDKMEFCLIQLNYLDYSLQDAKGKLELLAEYDIPVIVMEPLRGGALARLDDEKIQKLASSGQDSTAAEWAFRWLQGIPNIITVLSGMSSMDQLLENTRIFESPLPLEDDQQQLLLEIAEDMKDCVPCTGCRYCVDSCPQSIDIPLLMNIANDLRYAPTLTLAMTLDLLEVGRRPADCLSCGACASMFPQGIDIPEVLAQIEEGKKDIPSWIDQCKDREASAQRLRGTLFADDSG